MAGITSNGYSDLHFKNCTSRGIFLPFPKLRKNGISSSCLYIYLECTTPTGCTDRRMCLHCENSGDASPIYHDADIASITHHRSFNKGRGLGEEVQSAHASVANNIRELIQHESATMALCRFGTESYLLRSFWLRLRLWLLGFCFFCHLSYYTSTRPRIAPC